MEKFKFLKEETSFFSKNGLNLTTRKDFKDYEFIEVLLALDTGDKKDCALIRLDKNYNFLEVYQATNNSTREELEEYYTNNKNVIIDKLLELQTYLID